MDQFCAKNSIGRMHDLVDRNNSRTSWSSAGSCRENSAPARPLMQYCALPPSLWDEAAGPREASRHWQTSLRDSRPSSRLRRYRGGIAPRHEIVHVPQVDGQSADAFRQDMETCESDKLPPPLVGTTGEEREALCRDLQAREVEQQVFACDFVQGCIAPSRNARRASVSGASGLEASMYAQQFHGVSLGRSSAVARSLNNGSLGKPLRQSERVPCSDWSARSAVASPVAASVSDERCCDAYRRVVRRARHALSGKALKHWSVIFARRRRAGEILARVVCALRRLSIRAAFNHLVAEAFMGLPPSLEESQRRIQSHLSPAQFSEVCERAVLPVFGAIFDWLAAAVSSSESRRKCMTASCCLRCLAAGPFRAWRQAVLSRRSLEADTCTAADPLAFAAVAAFAEPQLRDRTQKPLPGLCDLVPPELRTGQEPSAVGPARKTGFVRTNFCNTGDGLTASSNSFEARNKMVASDRSCERTSVTRGRNRRQLADPRSSSPCHDRRASFECLSCSRVSQSDLLFASSTGGSHDVARSPKATAFELSNSDSFEGGFESSVLHPRQSMSPSASIPLGSHLSSERYFSRDLDGTRTVPMVFRDGVLASSGLNSVVASESRDALSARSTAHDASTQSLPLQPFSPLQPWSVEGSIDAYRDDSTIMVSHLPQTSKKRVREGAKTAELTPSDKQSLDAASCGILERKSNAAGTQTVAGLARQAMGDGSAHLALQCPASVTRYSVVAAARNLWGGGSLRAASCERPRSQRAQKVWR
eukprot:TRINITY_DN54573_c0_g1_i1.p1 TRINITY_DN54573_c0_g1~~TRINITY_DN54573_c0_g1_i1.p1  ORF type:complete len:763 (-),score=60.44 TRINITY_DN54573_c0_g1_i1:517-2805(-)